jgi:predicted phosphodiesterase
VRIALLSDIHGNPIALDAVLADVEAQGGVDEYLVLGDLAAIGYAPVAVLERVAALPRVRFIRGNTDRYLVTGDRPPVPPPPGAELEVAHSFAWSQGYVTGAGWFDWLARLPLDLRLELPDGTRVLCVHAAPGEDDGAGVNPVQSDREVGAILAGCGADLVFTGHTHWALDRTVDGVRAVNLGSVSNPWAPDLRAGYVLLDAGADGYEVRPRRVDYDLQAVIDGIAASHHPTAGYLTRWFLGRHFAPHQRRAHTRSEGA